jgi:hypothetical protein
MTNRLRTAHRALRALRGLGLLATLLIPSVAYADEERASLDTNSIRPIEIEPHFSFGAGDVYGTTGVGGGLRVSIPILDGHLGRVQQDLAITFGGDILHYDNCYYSAYCGANYLMLPVAAQWNVFVARPVSVFAEAGVFVYKGWFDQCAGDSGPGCVAPSDFGILPTLAIGGRLRLAENAAVTLRIGYPTVTLGVSFM